MCNVKKRYLVLAGRYYYPREGTGDWKKRFDTLQEAEEFVNSMHRDMYQWYDIIDLETFMVEE